MNRAAVLLTLGEHPKHWRKLAKLTERQAKFAMEICECSDEWPDFRFRQTIESLSLKPKIKEVLLAVADVSQKGECK